jgi:translation initiation factor IF-2
VKVQDLAKELGKKPSELLQFLQELGVKASNPTSKLDFDTLAQVRELFKNEKNGVEEEPDAPVEVHFSGTHLRVNEMADLFGKKLPEVMKAFLMKGLMVNLNSEIDAQTAVDIAKGLNVDLILDNQPKSASTTLRDNLDKIIEDEIDQNSESLTHRPPVITIMGHVDHGKTLLLDTIRKSNVILGESGGITQHIGAYQVKVKGHKLTFLDTPGHAAFTALRARGAQVTDIAILVVAADEGVKPQTIEALSHAKAANVPIMVAMNKMDKPDANPEMVKQQLSEHGLLPEDWGGTTIYVPISAKSNQGIDELLDMIILVTDMQELKAVMTGPAKGVVIESRLSRKKGPIATILIKTGCLRVGDYFVIDNMMGKVRALLDDLGQKVDQATPGSPVEVLGISEVPAPGSILEVMATEREARTLVDERSLAQDPAASKSLKAVSLEALSQQIEDGEILKLNLIVKADVNGSLEGILHSLAQIHTHDVAVNIIHSATGPVNENDIMLAKASSAIVIGFHLTVTPEAQKLAESENIEVKLYSIIYEIVDDIRKVVEGMFKPEFEDVELGRAEVRELFKFSKVGIIAGCFVTSGKITRNNQAQVFRGKKEIFKGKVNSLKRFAEDVREVASNFECGIVMDGFTAFEPGDIISVFEVRQKK